MQKLESRRTIARWRDEQRQHRFRDEGDKLKDIIYDENPSDHPDRNSRKKSDYGAFKTYSPTLLNNLLQGSSGDAEWADSSEIPVVIVSHSGYMKRNLGCKGSDAKGKPRNNEVWVQRYRTVLGAAGAELEPISCEKLLASEYYPLPPDRLCSSDVDRCKADSAWGFDPVPSAWLGRDAAWCADSGNGSSIFARDAATGELYTKE